MSNETTVFATLLLRVLHESTLRTFSSHPSASNLPPPELRMVDIGRSWECSEWIVVKWCQTEPSALLSSHRVIVIKMITNSLFVPP